MRSRTAEEGEVRGRERLPLGSGLGARASDFGVRAGGRRAGRGQGQWLMKTIVHMRIVAPRPAERAGDRLPAQVRRRLAHPPM